MFTELNEQLKEAAYMVLREAKSALYRIECTFVSAENSDVSVVPSQLNLFSVVQNFELDYGDVITAAPDISTEEAILLLSNYKDLWCTISFIPVTQHKYRDIDEEDPIVVKYKILIANAADLLKEYSKATLVDARKEDDAEKRGASIEAVRARRTTLTMQLFTEDFYNLRERPINTLFQKANLEAAVQGIAALLGIKNVKFMQADNTREYTTISIPPMHTLGTALDFLQEQKGVYQKGMEYYYTNETLFAYPGNDTDIQNSSVVHLYKVSENDFAGNKGYMYQESDTVYHILCNQQTSVENLAEKATEALGNYQVSSRTDAQIDVGREMKGKEGVIPNNTLISTATTNERSASTGRVTAKYVAPTNNPLAMTSELSKGMFNKLEITCLSIAPFKLTPGMKVYFHYEDVQAYKRSKGILASVEYGLRPIYRGANIIYTFAAKLIVKLSPDEDSDTSVSKEDLPGLSKGGLAVSM